MELLNNTLYAGIIFIIIGFISGSVPYGLLYSLARGVDIRKIGSGNIGATNVTRQFGFWQGFLPVVLLDALKGAVPIILFRIFVSRTNDPALFDIMEILVGIAAVLGHVFSPFLGFKGGKGIATTAGIVFAYNYIVGLVCVGVFGIVFFTFGKKIAGRASIVGGTCFPLVVYLIPNTTTPLLVISIVLAVLILFSHRKNIKEWSTGEDLVKKQQKKSK